MNESTVVDKYWLLAINTNELNRACVCKITDVSKEFHDSEGIEGNI